MIRLLLILSLLFIPACSEDTTTTPDAGLDVATVTEDSSTNEDGTVTEDSSTNEDGTVTEDSSTEDASSD
jgi:hypothetical protein